MEEKIKGQMVKKHILDLENFKHILTANESTVNSNIKDSHLPSSFFVKVDLIREKAQEHTSH